MGSKIYAMIKVKKDSELQDESIKVKGSKERIRIYRQEVGALLNVKDPNEYTPMMLELREDSEPLPEGYYGIAMNIQINKYKSAIEITPFSKIKVVRLPDTLPKSYEELVRLVDDGKHHKSVLEKREMKDKEEEEAPEAKPMSDDEIDAKIERLKKLKAA